MPALLQAHDVCSGECWGDRADCAGCSDAFDPDRLSVCKLCELQFCKVCAGETEEAVCDGCAKRVCDHHRDDPPGFTTCTNCSAEICAACDEKTVTAQCEAGPPCT